jgi:hypothetical protein
LLSTLVTGGVIASLMGAMITLVRMAVSAERRRADDWRTAATTSAEANKVLSGNLDKLINTVDQMANAQHEMMQLLRKVADGGGGPS